MSASRFIAGDWGTSNLRLYLCEFRAGHSSVILHTRQGPGVSEIHAGSEGFEGVFLNLIEDWIAEYGIMPAILSGMVGSTIGWQEAPYLECPLGAAQIARGRTVFEARGMEISIITGLKALSPLGHPDVMRGEELQLLGWMQMVDQSNSDTRLFALPGTHNKWALIRNGQIETFLTALTGELFAVLQKHSVLIADHHEGDFSEAAFFQGVAAVEQLGDAQLLHALFSTRSRQVLGAMPAADASSYLSGLILGADIMGAIGLFQKSMPEISTVTLIGDSQLNRYYQIVLERMGISAEIPDARQIAISGYEAIYKYLYAEGTK